MSMTDGREYRMHSGNMAAFRRAEEKDLAALCAIEERCFGTPWSETTLKEMLESPLDLVFMAELPDMPGVAYMIVSEAGASVYSASKLAAQEFPDFDVTQRSAVSIARRMQENAEVGREGYTCWISACSVRAA